MQILQVTLTGEPKVGDLLQIYCTHPVRGGRSTCGHTVNGIRTETFVEDGVLIKHHPESLDEILDQLCASAGRPGNLSGNFSIERRPGAIRIVMPDGAEKMNFFTEVIGKGTLQLSITEL